jgi:hypothetical protein
VRANSGRIGFASTGPGTRRCSRAMPAVEDVVFAESATPPRPLVAGPVIRASAMEILFMNQREVEELIDLGALLAGLEEGLCS